MLYLAANPVDPANPGKQRLRVEEEFREIQQTVSQSRERDNIRLESRWAVQPHDITEALFAVEPHFVHFAGHGDTKEGSIVVGDEYGYARTIPVDGVVRAFQAAGQGTAVSSSTRAVPSGWLRRWRQPVCVSSACGSQWETSPQSASVSVSTRPWLPPINRDSVRRWCRAADDDATGRRRSSPLFALRRSGGALALSRRAPERDEDLVCRTPLKG